MNIQKKNPFQFSPCQGRGRPAFTLVELIVVITILAILGTIAFISLQGYSSDARNSSRTSDLSRMKSSLELYNLESGRYPIPTGGTEIIYSGAVAWTQGTFGETVNANVSKLDKVPKDPSTDKEYVYSTTGPRNEYQLAGAFEGDLISMNNEQGIMNNVASSPLIRGELRGVSAAATKTAKLKLAGTYNGKVLKVSSGATTYVLAIPSIMTTTGTTLEEIVNNNYLAYGGYKNLPFQYTGAYNTTPETNLNFVNSGSILVFSGDISVLSDSTSTGVTARQQLIQNLQQAYTGTTISNIGEIAQILNTDTNNNTQTEYITTYLVKNDLGGSVKISGNLNVNNNVVVNYSCALPPAYPNATFTDGAPTSENQAWQNTNVSNPCYYSCNNGFGGNDCNTVVCGVNYINISGFCRYNDGNLNITSSTTFSPIIGNPTQNIVSGTNTINVNNGALFKVGEKILIINAQGINGGDYEEVIISNITANILTLTSNLTKSYNITNNTVIIQKIPFYQNATISQNYTVNPWNGTNGGIIAFEVNGDLTISSAGSINLNSKGFRGGERGMGGTSGAPGGGNHGAIGETWNVKPFSTVRTYLNTNGAGGGDYLSSGGGDVGTGGGGGGYGGAGNNGGVWTTANGGQGYGTYGINTLTKLLFGAGGGGGGGDDDANAGDGGDGGIGGGIIFIKANNIINSGTISSIGQVGNNCIDPGDGEPGGGGGGAGGSIKIVGNINNSGTISVVGGNGGACPNGNVNPLPGGNGGGGRIAIYGTFTNSGNISYGNGTYYNQ